ncbi:tripartite motif-containing protein 5-like [Pteronotus mesoamericanus]|uniref:tripartite motif-containing protein 5-like n=1 Tax=Pteronotus mesoamericanus TaxID=1884717 RepID=UPI0023ECF9CB|nr:tripartite motif-containing protein 5-like [Pteronotus parnellii mesoamericanus]XP_054436547.1 tripartite motif-containing protein 5-like [Pteronotus parnellii mesoamericanus]XP_054436548.1 tripartite motif-containing protein 5-like [Pteronotus parnellii mesoamericanus]
MASGMLLNIKEEVTCPICLELLTEPLSLDCGHTFCQACIIASHKESTVSKEGQSSCPVCRSSYQPGNLRPNRHVANIMDTFREVKLNPEEEQKTDLCVRHGEKLLLFCKEDGKFICWLCERSQEHRGHHTFLMEEVAQEYQEKLQAALDRLRTEHQEAEKLKANIGQERSSLKNEIQNAIHSVQDYFKELRGILDTEEQKELQKLKKEEGDILCVLEQSESELVQQSHLLKDLISDVEHRLQGSPRKMLQDVNGIMERSKTFTLRKPKTVSKKERRVFQPPDLRAILQVHNELTDVRRYWAHITLHPPNDNRNVAVSADLKQVRYEFHFDTNKNDSAVLGVPVITSGKHYWEVDVSEKQAWILGVYGEKNPVTSSYRPKNGYWVIGLVNQFKYKAFVESSPSSPLQLTLCLTVPPRRVGVFLDYDGGTVSFYNVTNHGFLIYKFSSCSFSQKIYPYLSPMKCTAPMTLCSPSS